MKVNSRKYIIQCHLVILRNQIFNHCIKLLKECKVNLKWRRPKEHSLIEWDRVQSMVVVAATLIHNQKLSGHWIPCRISFRLNSKMKECNRNYTKSKAVLLIKIKNIWILSHKSNTPKQNTKIIGTTPNRKSLISQNRLKIKRWKFIKLKTILIE